MNSVLPIHPSHNKSKTLSSTPLFPKLVALSPETGFESYSLQISQHPQDVRLFHHQCSPSSLTHCSSGLEGDTHAPR